MGVNTLTGSGLWEESGSSLGMLLMLLKLYWLLVLPRLLALSVLRLPKVVLYDSLLSMCLVVVDGYLAMRLSMVPTYRLLILCASNVISLG